MKKARNIYILLFLLLLVVTSCEENVNEPPLPNQAPNTEVFLFPDNADSLNQQKSRLSVHWWGDDPDGLVLGYYFRWVGVSPKWNFTPKNDSIFSLPIGSADTIYTFEVMAVDQEGNNKYDQSVMWNNEDLGPEPFIDENGNGIWDEGEFYYDIGMIDPTPAKQKFPIKNSAPEIEWSKSSVLPPETFPVITIAWDATDLDGDESIVNINLSLNDTTTFVALPGYVRIVTLRIKDANATDPEMEILINGSDQNIFEETLKGIKLDDNNKLFIQATDISGSSSPYIALPDTGLTWFVKKPKGDILIIDDYESGEVAEDFYNNVFSTISNGEFANKFDVMNIETTKLPFANITFLETMKLFKYVYWYADSSPSLELTSSVTQDYLKSGGKIFYSFTLQESSSSFEYDLATIQSFLPIDGFAEESPLSFLFAGANILPTSDFDDYPQLKTSSTISFVWTYIPSSLTARTVHNISSSQVNGVISLINNSKELFFIGLPLHQCNGTDGSVEQLIEKVFIDEFGLTQ